MAGIINRCFQAASKHSELGIYCVRTRSGWGAAILDLVSLEDLPLGDPEVTDLSSRS